ncbi:hypothetical protein ABQG65_22555 [Yersinia alsatica]|uniref:hypothetical protein n=1 Tax=Yersinia alsatica TaxID=2890317 RepID=UPI0032EBF830
MSIEFKILWIDDSADYLDSLNIDLVGKHINEQGFKVKFEFRITDEDIDMDVDGLKYDLIVIDYNLVKEGANKRGNSSRLTQSFHFFMFEPIFSPVNALNQPI